MPTPRKRPKSSSRQRNLPHLAGRLFNTPLLVDAQKLDAIVPAFLRRLNGEPDGDEVTSTGAPRDPDDPVVDQASGVAVIPIIGTLVRRPSMMDWVSGLTSYDDIACALRCALDDARVRAILLQVDSFGGEAGGCFELCQQIYDARAIKPVWAVGDIDALSAGYALLCSAEKCFVAERGRVGSIGVVSVHLERSQQNEMLGLTYTVFRAGDRKADGNPFETLAPELAEKQQLYMERTRQTFAETVSRNRSSLSVEDVLNTEGDFFDAVDGLKNNLVDGVNSYEGVFRDLTALVPAPTSARVAPPEPPAPVIEPDEDAPAEDDMAENATGALPATTASATPTPTVAAASPTPPNPAAVAAAAATVAPAELTTSPALEAARPVDAAKEIVELCSIAGKPELCATFISEGLSVGDVRKRLLTLRQEESAAASPAINNHQPPKPGANLGIPGFSTAAPSTETMKGWDDAFSRVHASNPSLFPAR